MVLFNNLISFLKRLYGLIVMVLCNLGDWSDLTLVNLKRYPECGNILMIEVVGLVLFYFKLVLCSILKV